MDGVSSVCVETRESVREEETQANNNCGQPSPHLVVIDSTYTIYIMKAFLLEFFGLASCLKQSSAFDEEAAHANNKRSNRGERHQQHNQEVSHNTQQRRRRRRRRRSSEEERHESSSYNIAHSSSSKRSLPLIDENSQLLIGVIRQEVVL